MEDILVLQYVILGLQIVTLSLMILTGIFLWVKFGRKAAGILNTASDVAILAQSFATEVSKSVSGNGLNPPAPISSRSDLEQASRKNLRRILVVGHLARKLHNALLLCSETNLVRIHSAFRSGPSEMERAIEEIAPTLDKIALIESEIGMQLVISLAYHYKIESYSSEDRELELKRKR
ncbi:MAG TPA: hypothetical protein VK463_17260 [Desulfomonilaceae bacterium]|nr:hypothetical protein [Desulfomonilaceae bacterium]